MQRSHKVELLAFGFLWLQELLASLDLPALSTCAFSNDIQLLPALKLKARTGLAYTVSKCKLVWCPCL